MSTDTDDSTFVGVDVGGTSIKLGWIDRAGRTLAETSIPTRPHEPADVAIARIVATIGPWLASTDSPVAAIGLGAPGPLDLEQGTLLTPVNLSGWQQFPVRQALCEASGKPVCFANDANAAAYGEYWLGSGKAYRSLVLLTLGTGVGSGIVIDDAILVGGTGNAAECGHATVDFATSARMCPCGQPGHLEAYASATAVGNIASELAAGPLADDGRRATPPRLSALDVFRAAEQGDSRALSVVDSTADYLVRGIVNIVFTVDPDIVLLGGAMDFGGPARPTGQRFLARIRQQVQKRVFSPVAARLKIEFAALGASAGWIGAAGLARRDYDSGKTQRPSP